MALKIERQGTTTVSLGSPKPQLCHTCKQRREGVFTTDTYGKPMCGECAREHGRPLP